MVTILLQLRNQRIDLIHIFMGYRNAKRHIQPNLSSHRQSAHHQSIVSLAGSKTIVIFFSTIEGQVNQLDSMVFQLVQQDFQFLVGAKFHSIELQEFPGGRANASAKINSAQQSGMFHRIAEAKEKG